MKSEKPGLLQRFALHRPELRAWAMYDWANSAFILVIITAVFPIYYQTVAAEDLDPERATFWFGIVTTISLLCVAIMAPILGALGDFLGQRKRMMAGFVVLGVLATAAMFFIQNGDWILALVLFFVGNLAVSSSFVFYDSLLPHIAEGEELDRISTAGYALGYLGSGLLLIVNLAWIQKPEWFGLSGAGLATRLSFVSVALWWAGFSIPLFRRVAEPPRQLESDESESANPIRVSVERIAETFHDLRGSYSEAFKMLLAVVIYNDGIGTIIRMAALYAATRGLPQQTVIVAILMVQFVGIPFAFLFGQLAGPIGAKRAILLSLLVYVAISIIAYRMTTVREFFILAFLVGMVQGGAQALSRSLFASMVPRHKAAEFFGLFSVFEKFAGIAGPLVFSLMIGLTGSSQQAILSVILFFVVGGLVLWIVDVDKGRRQARQSDRQLTASS